MVRPRGRRLAGLIDSVWPLAQRGAALPMAQASFVRLSFCCLEGSCGLSAVGGAVQGLWHQQPRLSCWVPRARSWPLSRLRVGRLCASRCAAQPGF